MAEITIKIAREIAHAWYPDRYDHTIARAELAALITEKLTPLLASERLAGQQAERERCANLAAQHSYPAAGGTIAAAIRGDK